MRVWTLIILLCVAYSTAHLLRRRGHRNCGNQHVKGTFRFRTRNCNTYRRPIIRATPCRGHRNSYRSQKGYGSYNKGYSGYYSPCGGYSNCYGRYNKGYSGYNKGSAGYNKGYGGYNKGSAGYNKGYGGYNKGYGGYNKGYAGYNKGYAGYNKGYGGYNKGYGGQNKGYGGQNKGYGGYSQNYGGSSQGYGGYNSYGKQTGSTGYTVPITYVGHGVFTEYGSYEGNSKEGYGYSNTNSHYGGGNSHATHGSTTQHGQSTYSNYGSQEGVKGSTGFGYGKIKIYKIPHTSVSHHNDHYSSNEVSPSFNNYQSQTGFKIHTGSKPISFDGHSQESKSQESYSSKWSPPYEVTNRGALVTDDSSETTEENVSDFKVSRPITAPYSDRFNTIKADSQEYNTRLPAKYHGTSFKISSDEVKTGLDEPSWEGFSSGYGGPTGQISLPNIVTSQEEK